MIVVVAFGFIYRPDERDLDEKQRENTEPKSLENIPVHVSLLNRFLIFSQSVFFGG
jgi:hypothetical protein